MSDKFISGTTAKKVLEIMFKTGKSAPEIIEENKWWLLSDEEIYFIVSRVVKENQDIVKKFSEGNTKLLNVLIGKTMKEVDGRAEAPTIEAFLLYEVERHINGYST